MRAGYEEGWGEIVKMKDHRHTAVEVATTTLLRAIARAGHVALCLVDLFAITVVERVSALHVSWCI